MLVVSGAGGIAISESVFFQSVEFGVEESIILGC